MRKQITISRLRERQKRLNLAAEQRKMEAYLKMERDQLFSEEKKKEANPEAHPYSGMFFLLLRIIDSITCVQRPPKGSNKSGLLQQVVFE